tara:strand:+ start:501 stop:896 length:396 start_codon:yes stop_codon:yes gene_type:complete
MYNLIKLTWVEFEECVFSIYKQCKYKEFVGVYGFPRGGLCLAVALSHSLGINLLEKPTNNCLIVDDIYETGYTLNKIKSLKGSEAYVWISKKEPTWWKSYKCYHKEEWIVFPWENINNVNDDRISYYKSRK